MRGVLLSGEVMVVCQKVILSDVLIIPGLETQSTQTCCKLEEVLQVNCGILAILQ